MKKFKFASLILVIALSSLATAASHKQSFTGAYIGIESAYNLLNNKNNKHSLTSTSLGIFSGYRFAIENTHLIGFAEISFNKSLPFKENYIDIPDIDAAYTRILYLNTHHLHQIGMGVGIGYRIKDFMPYIKVDLTHTSIKTAQHIEIRNGNGQESKQYETKVSHRTPSLVLGLKYRTANHLEFGAAYRYHHSTKLKYKKFVDNYNDAGHQLNILDATPSFNHHAFSINISYAF